MTSCQVCNINYIFTQKIPVKIHNLRRHGSHHIMLGIDKFGVKVNVTPNTLTKVFAFMLGKKEYIHLNMWIVLKDLTKPNCLLKRLL